MSSHKAASVKTQPAPGPVVNGVPTGQLMELIGHIQQDAGNAQFQFRLSNRWRTGAINRSRMDDLYADGSERRHDRPLELDADEPRLVAGEDTAPTPVEYVLHALASCLTTTMVYHASVQGIVIESVESKLEGDIDVRGFFGLSDQVRKGFNTVRVRMRVKSEASAETLRQLAMYSAVYDIVSNSLPVELILEKA
jgi:uncharacterized OsmC-like protein